MVNEENRRSVSNRINRRNFLRATSGAVVAAGAASLAGASDERVEGERPYPERGTIRVDHSLESVSPHYYLLTLDKGRMLELVDKSGRDESKRNEHRAFLKDIWRKYPVKQSREDDDIVYSLATDESRPALTTDEEKGFVTTAQAVGRGYAKESENISTEWFGSSHETMARNTLQNFDLYDYEIDDVASHAPDPDTDPCPECTGIAFGGSWNMPDWVRDKIQEGLNKIARHYNHYHDPNVYSTTIAGVDIEFGEVGRAPMACEDQITKAKNNSYWTQREHLGRALHYSQDVGNPLHTGMGIEQMNLGLHCDWDGCAVLDPRKEMHAGYERYVNQNLTSGKRFIDDYNSKYVYNWDPAQVIKNCADSTSQYSYELFHLMMNNGNDVSEWTDSNASTRVEELTRNSVTEAGGYSYALVEQVY